VKTLCGEIEKLKYNQFHDLGQEEQHMGFFDSIKEKFGGTFSSEEEEKHEESTSDEYVELGTDTGSGDSSKITVRPFIMEDFDDIRVVLDALRSGHTIALVNIRPLKDKDLIELKRAINKLKKTVDAISGDIAGFGDDWICVTPAFAHIHRAETHEP